MTENKIGVITGWKRIAEFFDVSVSTAKRWHKKRRLPLRRTPGGQPSAVPAELGLYFSKK